MAKKILIMSLTRMGDLVQATPLIAGLRQKHPGAEITLMVSSDFAEFATRVPHVDDIVAFNIRQFTKRMAGKEISWVEIYRYLEGFLNDLKARHYDHVVNLSHSKLSALMILYLGIKRVTGFFCNETGDRVTEHPWMQYFGIEPFNRIYNPFNLVEIFTRSGDIRPEGLSIQLKIPGEAGASTGELVVREKLDDEELIIGIQAGSSLEGRRWPASRFAELADQLVENHNARILLFGVASESILAGEITAAVKRKERVTDLTGKTSIVQLMGLLRKCRYLVTNDTGTMHIAAALGVRIVGLFFAHAHPHETGPYTPGNLVFQARISCAPCSYGVHCNNIVCIRHVLPHHIQAMIGSHIQEGTWKVPPDLPGLKELSIFQTRTDADRGLVLQPLIRHPVTLEDIFRYCYSRFWLETFGNISADVLPDSGARSRIAETIRKDFDCRDVSGVLERVRVKLGILTQLRELGRQGMGLGEKILHLCRPGSDSQSLRIFAEAISRIDGTIDQIGCVHPELKPITDIFNKRKENFQGEEIESLAEATYREYYKLREESERMGEILSAVVETLADPAAPGDQVAASSINALVPGR